MEALFVKLADAGVPAGRAFIRLLNMSVSAAVLILAVVLVRLVFRRAPKWTRAILWAIVALRLMLPFTISSPVSVYNLVADAPEAVEVFREDGGSEKPLVSFDTYVYSSAPGSAAPEDAAPAPAVGRTDTAAQTASVERRTHSVYIPTAMKIWVIGICAMALYALISILILRLKLRPAVDVGNRVRVSDGAPTPFILGVFRPRIYMPSALGEKQATAALAHERAHLRRGDHVWKLLAFVLLAVHWFNPLVWLAFVLFGRDLELICDERVIRGMDAGERADYSQALLDCSIRRTPVVACPLAFAESGVKTRIKSVLNYKKPAFWIVAAVIVVCIAVGVCFLTGPARTEKAPDLSFLNYKNALSLIADRDEVQGRVHIVRKGSDNSYPVSVDPRELAKYLDNLNTGDYPAPNGQNRSTKYVDLMIDEGYSICVYNTPHLMKVSLGDEERWYTCSQDDFGDLLQIVYAKYSDLSQLPPLPEKREYVNEDTFEISRDGDNFIVTGEKFGELTLGTSFEDAAARGFGSVYETEAGHTIVTNYNNWFGGAVNKMACYFDDENGLYLITFDFEDWYQEGGNAEIWFELYRKLTELFGTPDGVSNIGLFTNAEELQTLMNYGEAVGGIHWGDPEEKYLVLNASGKGPDGPDAANTVYVFIAWEDVWHEASQKYHTGIVR